MNRRFASAKLREWCSRRIWVWESPGRTLGSRRGSCGSRRTMADGREILPLRRPPRADERGDLRAVSRRLAGSRSRRISRGSWRRDSTRSACTKCRTGGCWTRPRSHGLKVFGGLKWGQSADFFRSPGLYSAAVISLAEGLREIGGHPALAGIYVGNEMPADLVRWMGPVKVRRGDRAS